MTIMKDDDGPEEVGKRGRQHRAKTREKRYGYIPCEGPDEWPSTHPGMHDVDYQHELTCNLAKNPDVAARPTLEVMAGDKTNGGKGTNGEGDPIPRISMQRYRTAMRKARMLRTRLRVSMALQKAAGWAATGRMDKVAETLAIILVSDDTVAGHAEPKRRVQIRNKFAKELRPNALLDADEGIDD